MRSAELLPTARRHLPLPLAVIATAALLLVACGGGDAASPAATGTAPATTAAPSTTTTAAPSSTSVTSTTTTTTTVAPVEVTADSFVNLADMTPVRGFFVDNLLGDLPATLAVAESPDGGTYPAGSVVQLFPGEAMVKREAGFSPDTNDWEFFELRVDDTGTRINVRGAADAVNMFGGNCADCHALAEPQWDFICEQDHGCEPLPVDRSFIEGLQRSDPRPRLTAG